MRTIRSILTAVVWLPILTALAAAQSGALSGLVVDDKGAPIAGASVFYRAVPTVARTASGQQVATGPVVGSMLKTAADGSFAAGNLPAALYHLCAYGTKSDDLGSCEWGQGTTGVDLAPGQTAQLRFVVAEGTLLTFQVEDPEHQVQDLESLPTVSGRVPLSGANFAIGVWSGNRYARAGLISTDGATRTYQVAIPKTANVRLYLDTSLNVLDANGMGLLLRGQSATLVAGGQAEVIVNLTIP